MMRTEVFFRGLKEILGNSLPFQFRQKIVGGQVSDQCGPRIFFGGRGIFVIHKLFVNYAYFG